MFGRNTWTDRLREKLTDYVDEKFVDYRERLANDLARGVAALAILVVKWSLLLLLVFFSAIMLAFFAAELLRPYFTSWAYTLGFGMVLCILITLLLWFRTRLNWMEHKVFDDIKKSLLDEKDIETIEAESEPETKPEMEETSADIVNQIEIEDPTELFDPEMPKTEDLQKGKDPFRD